MAKNVSYVQLSHFKSSRSLIRVMMRIVDVLIENIIENAMKLDQREKNRGKIESKKAYNSNS